MPDRFDSGTATDVLATHTVDYNALYERVRAAASAVIGANSADDPCQRDLGEILLSMLETHESMRSVYSMAARIEEKELRKTGCWMDTLLMARPQYDALFIAMLLAHDYKRWGRDYRKAGWGAEAQRTFYQNRRFRKTAEGRRLHSENIRKLKEWARREGVSVKEWVATVSPIRGMNLRRGATAKDDISRLPTPGEAMRSDAKTKPLLCGGKYETLAVLLWQHWKFLCDPAHIGMSILMFKGALRDRAVLGGAQRESVIQERVIQGAIFPSLVAIMTLVTILALFYPTNVDVRAVVVEAWKDLDSGTLEGNIIWQEWARQSLGILGV